MNRFDSKIFNMTYYDNNYFNLQLFSFSSAAGKQENRFTLLVFKLQKGDSPFISGKLVEKND